MEFKKEGLEAGATLAKPSTTDAAAEQQAEARDHIARAMSEIDHNLEMLANAVKRIAAKP